MAEQVDPIKPTLKAPVPQRLKLHYDKPLSTFAFKFNLRRYIVVVQCGDDQEIIDFADAVWGVAVEQPSWRGGAASPCCQPTLKPPGTKRLKLKYDEVDLTFAFKVMLRRYMMGLRRSPRRVRRERDGYQDATHDGGGGAYAAARDPQGVVRRQGIVRG
jgi:hypothetical protein